MDKDCQDCQLISIHALLAESDIICLSFFVKSIISIHALLAESDLIRMLNSPHSQNFYPRSPCGERRWPRAMTLLCLYFYPRSPCGERLG